MISEMAFVFKLFNVTSIDQFTVNEVDHNHL